nr:hypothetical protein [Tanacetum cinerariifolium]
LKCVAGAKPVGAAGGYDSGECGTGQDPRPLAVARLVTAAEPVVASNVWLAQTWGRLKCLAGAKPVAASKCGWRKPVGAAGGYDSGECGGSVNTSMADTPHSRASSLLQDVSCRGEMTDQRNFCRPTTLKARLPDKDQIRMEHFA